MSDVVNRTYIECRETMSARLAGKSEAEQWWEINTTQIRESYLAMAARINELESQLAQARREQRETDAAILKRRAIEYAERSRFPKEARLQNDRIAFALDAAAQEIEADA